MRVRVRGAAHPRHQQPQSLHDVFFHGVLADSEPRGDLALRQAIDLAQQKHLAAFVRQCRQRFADAAQLLTGNGVALG